MIMSLSTDLCDAYLAYLDSTLESDERPMSFAQWKGTVVRTCSECARGTIATSTNRCSVCSAPAESVKVQRDGR